MKCPVGVGIPFLKYSTSFKFYFFPVILEGCPADTLGVYNREKMVIKNCQLWQFMFRV
jgi:hypothetical protein